MPKFTAVMDQSTFKSELKKVVDDNQSFEFKVLEAEGTTDDEIEVGFYVGRTVVTEFVKAKRAMKNPKVYSGTIRRSARFPTKRLLLDTSKFGDVKKLAPPCFKQANLHFSLLKYDPSAKEPDLTDDQDSDGNGVGSGQSVVQNKTTEPQVPSHKGPDVEQLKLVVQRLDQRLTTYTQTDGHQDEPAKLVHDKLTLVEKMLAEPNPDTIRAEAVCLEIATDLKNLPKPGESSQPSPNVAKLVELQSRYEKLRSEWSDCKQIDGYDVDLAAKIDTMLFEVEQMLKVEPQKLRPESIEALCVVIADDLKILASPKSQPSRQTLEELESIVEVLDRELKQYTQTEGHRPGPAKLARDKLTTVEKLLAEKEPDTIRAQALCEEIAADVKKLPKPGDPVVPPFKLPSLDQLRNVYQKLNSDLTNFTQDPGHDQNAAAPVRLKLNRVEQMLKADPKGLVPANIKALCLEIGEDLKGLPQPKPLTLEQLAAIWQKLDKELQAYENLARHDDAYAKHARTQLSEIDQSIKAGGDPQAIQARLKQSQAVIANAPPPPPMSNPLDPNLAQRAKELTDEVMQLEDKDPAFVKQIMQRLAEALDPSKNIVDRDAVLDVIEGDIIEKQNANDDEGRQLSPQQQKAKDKLDQANKFEAQRRLQVVKLGAVLSPEIIAIMNDHNKKVPTETAAFKNKAGHDIRFMDDLFAMKDQAERLKKVREIAAALKAVKERRTALGLAINNNPGFQPPDKGDPDGRAIEIKEGVELVRGFWMNMANHIPDEFDLYTKERDFGERLKTVEDSSGKSDEDRRRDIDGLANVPQTEKDEERKAFLDAIGHGSLKPAELTAFYFDDQVRPLTDEQRKAVMEANEKIIQRAYKIHDMGGKVEDVEKSLAHIPEEFWPPQFIEDMQAWRKVEREIAEERVSEMFADPHKLKAMDIFGAVTGVAGMLGDVMSLIGGCSDIAKGVQIEMQYQELHDMGLTDQQILDTNDWLSMLDKNQITDDQYKALEAYKGIGGPLDGPKLDDGERVGKDVRFVVDEMKEVSKTLNPIVKAGDPDNLTVKERFKSIPEKDLIMISGKLLTIISKVKSIGAVSSGCATFANNVCPILAAVGSGFDLAAVCKELHDICKEREIAIDQQKLNELNFFSGQNTDKAMLGALRNEKNARNRQRTKKRVEVAGKAVSFAGDAIGTGTMVDPTGGTAITGATLKVIGKGIEFGNKLVFAGIDWSIATKAMKTLDEAQAGNPVARVEIFKECGLYAKMYICVAARDGSPVAKQYIIDRGLTEGDLTRPMVLKILREKLLKKSDQKDESKNTDLGGVLVENVMGSETRKVGNRLVDKIHEGMESLGKKLRTRFPGPPYVAGAWTPPSPSELTKAEWDAEKRKAIENGLAMVDEGLGKALDSLGEIVDKARKALLIEGDSEANKKARAKMIGRVIVAAQSVADLAGSMDPATNDGQQYPEMLDCLVDIRGQALDLVRHWNKKFYFRKVGAKVTQWTPVAAANLEPGFWDMNWNYAREKCMLDDDHGVGQALQAYEDAQKSSGQTSRDPGKVRKAKLAERDALRSVAQALNACSAGAGEFPDVVAYCNTVLTAVIQASQVINGQLTAGAWDGSPKGVAAEEAFQPDFVREVFDCATAEGFMTGGDQGLLKALRKLAEAQESLDKLPPRKREEIGEARATLIEYGAEVAMAVAKIRKSNIETHQDFNEFLDLLETTAHEHCQVARDEFAKVSFTYRSGIGEAIWDEAYNNAVTAGAVPKNDTAHKKLSDALSKWNKAYELYLGEEKPDEKLVKANDFLQTLIKLRDSVQVVGNSFGFENPTMVEYLGKLQKLITNQDINSPILQRVLNGQVSDEAFTAPTTFHWSHKAWTDIKDQAVKLGLMPAKQTGFGKALEVSKDSYRKWDTAKTDERTELRDAAKADLDQVINLAKVVKSKTKNAKLLAYLKLFDVEAARRATELA